MSKVFLSIVMTVILFFTIAPGPLTAHAQGASYGEDALMANTSTDDAQLEAEARQLGVSADQTTTYVVEVKDLNKLLEQGSLTRTEYIGAKRRLLERLQ